MHRVLDRESWRMLEKNNDTKLCIREYQELNFVKNKQCIEKTKKKCTEMLSSVHNFKNN